MSAHILVVEDDRDLLNALAEVLDYVGYTVTTSQSGKDALHKVAYNRYDLIVCDHHLRDMTGAAIYEAARRAAIGRHMTPFLIFTGDRQRVLEAYPELSAEDFISKSATMDQLEEHIKRVLNSNRA